MKLAIKFCLIAFLMVPVAAISHEDSGEESSVAGAKSIKLHKTFLINNKGQVHVVVRDDGHLANQPFMVEVRPACGNKQKHWQELEVADMTTACGVNLKSLKLNVGKDEITIQVYKVDWDDYNAQARANQGRANAKCMKKPETFRVAISKLCKEK